MFCVKKSRIAGPLRLEAQGDGLAVYRYDGSDKREVVVRVKESKLGFDVVNRVPE